jgi:hypothetical protein
MATMRTTVTIKLLTAGAVDVAFYALDQHADDVMILSGRRLEVVKKIASGSQLVALEKMLNAVHVVLTQEAGFEAGGYEVLSVSSTKV